MRIKVAGKSISYSGDTEWTENLLALADGSDLLIAECCAYDQPTPSHLDYQTLLQRRTDLNCKQLMLTHLGPKMLQQRDALQIAVLNDGDLIVL